MANITSQLVDRRSHARSLLERQARVLIEDAENHRSIFHKLDARNLLLYEFYYSSVACCTRRIALAVLLLLPFFEWPSSLTLSSDLRLQPQRPRLPCGVTEAIEAGCIVILLIDSTILAVVFGRISLLHNPWLLGRFILFPVYTIDWAVSLCMGCNEFYRIRRFLRPYFLISGSQMMKKLLKSLKRTLPKLLSTLFLLLFWLVCATLVALCLLARPPDVSPPHTSVFTQLSNSFPDFYTSMFNLLVLLTTANHPDGESCRCFLVSLFMLVTVVTAVDPNLQRL
ncbi:Two pore calcium channel protein 2 [Fasciolopsis buskii]|uniref:Two pore calcium channel protein 2 n=1 Tax=Fasciolopsis buskii TaxID=27845 RepID=A0A8E0VFM0_9TREM|nr:Two pore calcium channel protein 2 [Fasciolopsis buski]